MFNKETEYALRALVYIKIQNIKGKRPGTDEIAREINAPFYYMAKILQQLSRSGLIQSLKGKGGGFFFDRERKELTISDLLIVTGNNKRFDSCAFGFKQCSDENKCPLHDSYVPIRNSIDLLVSTHTIDSMAIDFLNNRKEISLT